MKKTYMESRGPELLEKPAGPPVEEKTEVPATTGSQIIIGPPSDFSTSEDEEYDSGWGWGV